MTPVIAVEKLGKKYHIGSRLPYKTLRESIMNLMARPFKRLETSDAIWALKDVSFEVNKGEVLGIIGRNGSGKSTLLKILSRITDPTEGEARIRGRVASLLEVGTGFHPELSGRENVFLNGAVLGMSKAEIKKKFDEIVAFSEVERFLDTPVKRYSSGMYVRLAFAVAAHLEPEILVVDEVLAVGDVQFQRKCLGKMGEVARSGRTVLFVSHNMTAINRLCSRCIYLDHGTLIDAGIPSNIVQRYLTEGFARQSGEVIFSGGQNDDIRFISACTLGPDGLPRTSFRSDENIRIKVTYEVKYEMSGVSVAINITTGEQESLWSMGDWEQYPELFEKREQGKWTGEWVVPADVLRPGRYFIACGAGNPSRYFHHPDPFPFEITVEGAWRPAYRQFGVSGGPLAYKMRVEKPVRNGSSQTI